MRSLYDVFEKFPDGSTLWRASTTGKFETQRRIQSLAEHSDNEFYAIRIQSVGNLPQILTHNARPSARSAAEG
jgi:hypothetical protein